MVYPTTMESLSLKFQVSRSNGLAVVTIWSHEFSGHFSAIFVIHRKSAPYIQYTIYTIDYKLILPLRLGVCIFCAGGSATNLGAEHDCLLGLLLATVFWGVAGIISFSSLSLCSCQVLQFTRLEPITSHSTCNMDRLFCVLEVSTWSLPCIVPTWIWTGT